MILFAPLQEQADGKRDMPHATRCRRANQDDTRLISRRRAPCHALRAEPVNHKQHLCRLDESLVRVAGVDGRRPLPVREHQPCGRYRSGLPILVGRWCDAEGGLRCCERAVYLHGIYGRRASGAGFAAGRPTPGDLTSSIPAATGAANRSFRRWKICSAAS